MSDSQYGFSFTHIKCPIESITGIWEFTRPPYFKYLCYSLTGHLLHFVTQGSYIIRINGREYSVEKGDIIYYYETEEVETIGNDNEVIFYSVSYQASKLLPLPIENRVFPANHKLGKLFLKLYTYFSSENNISRRFLTYSILLKILNSIEDTRFDFENKNEEDNLWWEIERRIRKEKIFRPCLDDLLKISGYSKSTVIRSCKKVTGEAPMQRIRKIRMEEARGLLSFAHLNVTQISEYLGYGRLNEFSRDFSKYYGEPPSNLLKNINVLGN